MSFKHTTSQSSDRQNHNAAGVRSKTLMLEAKQIVLPVYAWLPALSLSFGMAQHYYYFYHFKSTLIQQKGGSLDVKYSSDYWNLHFGCKKKLSKSHFRMCLVAVWTFAGHL